MRSSLRLRARPLFAEGSHHGLGDGAAVRSVLARVLDSIPDPAFLDRLDLWLILAEDSPGVEFPD